MHRCIGCRQGSMKSAESRSTAETSRVVWISAARHSRRAELEFLPAALEIVETPPSPRRRAIAATIMALFATTLAWSAWGTVDIVATATGKIVPSGRSKVIQPFETGVVRAIRVEDG